MDYNNVFYEVYRLAETKAHSLFIALDCENIQSIILDNGIWWTEKNTYSKGLSDKQHKQLNKIMQDTYKAEWLYN